MKRIFRSVIAVAVVFTMAFVCLPTSIVKAETKKITTDVIVGSGESMVIKKDAPVEITPKGSLTIEDGGTLTIEDNAELKNYGSLVIGSNGQLMEGYNCTIENADKGTFAIENGGYARVLDNAKIICKDTPLMLNGTISITGQLVGSVKGTGYFSTVIGMDVTTLNDGLLVNGISVKAGTYTTGKIAFCGLSPETAATKDPEDWIGVTGIITDSKDRMKSSLYDMNEGRITTHRIGNNGMYFTINNDSYDYVRPGINLSEASVLGSYVNGGEEYWALKNLDGVGEYTFARWGERWPGQACSYDQATGIFIMDTGFNADFKGLWKDPSGAIIGEETVVEEVDKTIKVGKKITIKVKTKIAGFGLTDASIVDVKVKGKKKKLVIKGIAPGVTKLFADDKKGNVIGEWTIKVE